MSKLTVQDVAEATAKALRALSGAVGQGDHSPDVDAAIATLSPEADSEQEPDEDEKGE